MPDITDIDDSPNMPMDDRLNLQALKNKQLLDDTLDFDFFLKLEKKEILAMLMTSTILMAKGAEHIAQQRGQITRFQMDRIQEAFNT